MKIRLLFIIVLFLENLSAQPNFLNEGSKAYEILNLIHDFKFIQAKKQIDANKKNFQAETFYFLKINYFWWAYIISNDKKNYRDSLVYYLKANKKILSRKNKKNQFISLMTNGFEYRLAFKEDRFLDGLSAAYKMASQIQNSLDSAGQSPYYKLTAAIYLYSTGYGKEKYWFLYPYFQFIPPGDMNKGKEYLKELSAHSNEVLATESTYTLMRIYMDIEHNYNQALPLATKLTRWHPDNLFYLALEMKLKQKLNRLDESDKEKYENIYRQTVFPNAKSRQFFSDWRNIR